MAYELEQQQLADRLRRAQLLQQDQIPQGQMVSGHYVNPSITQYLASGLRQYLGGQEERAVQQEQKALVDSRQKAIADALRGFNEKAQGTPADTIAEGLAGPVRPALAPDMQSAFSQLMGSKEPSLQQAGIQGSMSLSMEQAKRQAALAEQQRQLSLLRQAGSPQAAIAAGVSPELVKTFYEARNLGRDEVTFQDVGGQKVPVTKYGDRPTNIAPLEMSGNPFKDLVVRGPDGQIVPNAPLVSTKEGIARAGKPQVNVDARNFNTQESEQSKVYGKQLGEMRGAITQAGYDAPGKLARLDRMEQLLAGIDGGAAAPAMADIASVANSLGIKIDPKLGNKQAAEALAREMAGSLRQPGTGPMTDKDFDNFLKQVPSLSKTAEGRTQIITTMRAAIERDQRASQFAREYARQNNGVIDDNFFDALSGFYAQNPVVTPKMPKANARGQIFDQADAIIRGGR